MLVIVIFTAETSYGARCLFILLKNFLLKKPDYKACVSMYNNVY